MRSMRTRTTSRSSRPFSFTEWNREVEERYSLTADDQCCHSSVRQLFCCAWRWAFRVVSHSLICCCCCFCCSTSALVGRRDEPFRGDECFAELRQVSSGPIKFSQPIPDL